MLVKGSFISFQLVPDKIPSKFLPLCNQIFLRNFVWHQLKRCKVTFNCDKRHFRKQNETGVKIWIRYVWFRLPVERFKLSSGTPYCTSNGDKFRNALFYYYFQNTLDFRINVQNVYCFFRTFSTLCAVIWIYTIINYKKKDPIYTFIPA